MTTKSFCYIGILFFFSLFSSQILAHPSFKGVSKQIIVNKRTDSNTFQALTIYWKGTVDKDTKTILSFEKIMGAKALMDIAIPLKAPAYLFRPDLSTEYPIKLEFVKSLDTINTDIIRLILKDSADSKKGYDTLLVFLSAG